MAASTIMVVGSLNRVNPYFQGARGVGLSVYAFDETTAQTSLLREAGGVDNPSFLSVTADGRHIYANSEVFGWAEGLVSAFALTAAPPRLRAINMQPAPWAASPPIAASMPPAVSCWWPITAWGSRR